MTLFAAVAAGGLGGCTPDSDGIGSLPSSGGDSGSGSASDSGTSASSGSASSSGSGSTGSPLDPEAFCAQFQAQGDCEAAGREPMLDLPCAWLSFTPVTRTGDSCQSEPDVEMCVLMTGDTSAAGCAVTPGCDDSDPPFFRPRDGGGILLDHRCGGSPPSGFTECETGFADVADPPECACGCELPLPMN